MRESFYTTLGENIAKLRHKNNLSRYALAKGIDTSSAALLNWERGDVAIRLEKASQIANFFGISIDELIDPQLFDSEVKVNDNQK